MTSKTSALLRWLLCLLCALPLNAAGALAPSDFFGEFIGSTQDDKGQRRDLSVEIGPADDGDFFVRWVTLIHRHSGERERKSYRVRFARTERSGIYQSVMRTNVFGGKAPLDPLQGKPFFWARIQEKTLSVYAFLINDSGGYQMQVYDRRLTDQGLHLSFVRRDSEKPQMRVEAELSRVGD